MADLVTITVDGVEMQGPAGEVLIKVAEENGNYIPRFCWHPRMNPVALCRMCQVEVVGPRGRMLVPSCSTRINDGMVVDTQSAVVKKAQEGVLEFLLINHPLDCPVCDKGGECPLQDHTVAYGPGESRFVEEKRHYPKPIPISELILLDRERCILCARCTRFCEEISGDPLIEFRDRGNAVQVITFPDEPFTSYFSGNTVQICPVGALTAAPYRFKARPWDLEAVESVSMVDAVGSKVSVQSSQNTVVRIDGVDNDPTNQGWLSDKDRFIFESVNSEHRLTTPLIKRDGELFEATWGEALDFAADKLASYPGAAVAGLGGANSTNEEAFAFGKFLRTIVVTPHVDAQLDDGLDPQFLVGVTPRASIPDLETAKTILLWAGDLKEELPVLYLRVRRAAAELGANLIVVHPRRTGLDDVASHKIRYRPGTGPDVLRDLMAGDGEYAAARAALDEGPVVAIVGRTGLSEDPRLAEAVAAFVRDLPEGKIMPMAHRANVVGALDMGLAPSLLPGRVSESSAHVTLEAEWGPLPEGLGRNATSIFEGLRDGDLQALIMVGTDPVSDHPEPALAAAGLAAADFVVSFDHFLNDSAAMADVVFPVLGFAEAEGTVTNIEGRVQKVNRLVPGPGQAKPTWSALDDLARRMGGDIGATSAEALTKEIATVAPAYHGVTWDALDWGEGREGMVLPIEGGTQHLQYIPVDGNLASVQARFGLHLGRVLYDDGVRTRMSPSLAALVPAAHVYMNAAEVVGLGLNPGDVALVESESGMVSLPIAVDNSLGNGAVYVPANLAETRELGAAVTVVVSAGGEA
ncbi:MAG: NADH-quinone oxidoreductase subunit NuoG [Acidimicrobiia bacterium]|nr:NADH-quinone oxidoreductase subunit NuoG [Acidimicrobiia bacterium]MDX2467511.1 NADH-quinone oxidoreductase subunit NuoG [Acidimicrobiia bacterium]